MNKKVVIVTGASRGIGSSIARLFASNNYDVVICYNKEKEKADYLSKEIKESYNVETLVCSLDISLSDSVENMFNSVINKFNRIDVLINNAGIAIDTLYEDKNVENFRKILDTNLIGTFLVSKYVGDYMYSKKSGCIINISSTNSLHQYYPMCLDYDASKAGVNSLTHNLALQYSPYIRVNAVAPGWVKTESEMKDLDQDYIKSEEENIYVHRFASPDEIASVVYFLASDSASYINNEIIRVDGGTRHE